MRGLSVASVRLPPPEKPAPGRDIWCSLVGEQCGNPLLSRGEAVESLPPIGVGLVKTVPKILDCPVRIGEAPL